METEKNIECQSKYLNPYLGGLVLGIVLFLSFFITGNGLGASGAVNRIVVAAAKRLSHDHVNRKASESKYAGGMKCALNHFSVFMLLGTLIGGLLSGIYHGRAKLETNKGPNISVKTRWVMAFFGGGLMGFGARVARGCTSGQALSGGAVLSLGSWCFMFSVFGGGYALAYFLRKAWY